ncbi:MAG TPA: hypothetical protein VK150_02015 [Geothrix sp.]|nr:hypothetical protein [Geothrix sp.]
MPKSALIVLSILLGLRGALYLWTAYRWEKDRREALDRLRRHRV